MKASSPSKQSTTKAEGLARVFAEERKMKETNKVMKIKAEELVPL